MITTRTFILDWFVWVLQKPSSHTVPIWTFLLLNCLLRLFLRVFYMSLDFYAIRLNECLAVSLSLRSFPDLRLTAWELPASNEILALTAVSGVGWKVLFPLLFSLLLEHHCKFFTSPSQRESQHLFLIFFFPPLFFVQSFLCFSQYILLFPHPSAYCRNLSEEEVPIYM